jgi:hypothetical protein
MTAELRWRSVAQQVGKKVSIKGKVGFGPGKHVSCLPFVPVNCYDGAAWGLERVAFLGLVSSRLR